MKSVILSTGTVILAAALACGSMLAQAPSDPYSPADPGAAPAPPPSSAAPPDIAPAILEWTPPALAELGTQAVAKESFTLDRTMLAAAAALMPDSDDDIKPAIAKLQGVSVHMLRFAQPGMVDPAAIETIRLAYHLRGWKHLITATNTGGPVHDNSTDLWVVLDGANLRGAVVLVDTPRSLTLAAVAGNLDPVDLLHLRGHFGIPRFDADQLNGIRR
jgi:hypothetical protein